MEIVGDRGSLTIDLFKQQVAVYNNNSIKAQWACWTDDPNLGLVKGFIKMIREKGQSPISGTDGLKALEVALGAYRSVESGKPVALPLE